jgi:hypothetical protein
MHNGEDVTGQKSIIFFSPTTKGKAIPLEAWTGLEGSRRLRISNFETVDT